MIAFDLKCEHAREPLAIERSTPRLSWKIESTTRGDHQSAYRIQCAGDRAALLAGRADVWDSGKFASQQSNLVPYGGSALSSFSTYWWRVQVWDAAGDPGPWSEPSFFGTSAFDPGEWTAKWITKSGVKTGSSSILKIEGEIANKKDATSHSPWAMYFHKKFAVNKDPRRACVYVSGLGYYELEINGRRVGDHRLDPGQTDYTRVALYSAYDVKELLVKGENRIRFTLANGRHIDAYGYGAPRGILQLRIDYTDGGVDTIVSDESFRFSYGPVHENGVYFGEVYDARDEGTPAELDRLEPAELAPSAPLRAQLMAPIRATATLSPIALTNPKPGAYVFDLGQNFAGVVRLRVSGPRGTEVRLRYSELVAADGSLHLGTNREATACDTYVLSGEGVEEYEPRFTYHGFRYVEVTGYPGVPTAESLRGVVLHTDVERIGSFRCSNQLVNRIHDIVQWSQRSNLMSVPTDCPQRGERMGWLGDAQIASEQAVYNLDMAAFYAKYLDDIRLSQRDDGSLSDVTPPYWPLYPADPAWGTAYVTLAWAMYWFYGDVEALRAHYEPMKRYVDFLDSRAEGNVLRSLGKYGDWCPPASTFPKRTPIELTSSWYYYHDTRLFSRIAGVLGERADAERYARRAEAIRDAFNAAFLLNGQYATLRMSPIDDHAGQTSQALPLYLEMVPEAERAAALEKLVHEVDVRFDRHVDAGIVGVRYLFEVLRDAGEAELAYDVITQESYPGWGYMIAQGATTVWERWENLRGMGMNSHNHIMLGSVDAWFYRTIAGIRPTAPGWEELTIAPLPLRDLTHAQAAVTTLRGRVEVAWRRDGSTFELDVVIPPGAQATLHVPKLASNALLFERSGQKLARVAAASVSAGAIRSVAASEEKYELRVGGGSYRFVSRAE